ncbi:MAG: hypothetical protein R3A79_07345 [Nannocystaceae bacterium]
MRASIARRGAAVGLGLAAALVGTLVGGIGCGAILCRCPDLTPVDPGTFEVDDNNERPELAGAIVEATPERVEISYTLEDESTWVVTYAVVHRAPEDD